jgi:hypothetical protein
MQAGSRPLRASRDEQPRSFDGLVHRQTSGDPSYSPDARPSLRLPSPTTELKMSNDPTNELIISSAAASLTAALAMQNAFTASLMSMLTEKGLFTPDEIRALLVRAADKSSAALKRTEGYEKPLMMALHHHVEGLLKRAEF